MGPAAKGRRGGRVRGSESVFVFVTHIRILPKNSEHLGYRGVGEEEGLSPFGDRFSHICATIYGTLPHRHSRLWLPVCH